MKHHLSRKLFMALALCGAHQLFAQGTFQNLDFESAHNIPVFDPQGHPWTMPASDALPSWTCYIGTSQIGAVAYNDVALDSAQVGILSSTSPYPPPGFVQGQYCLSLQTSTFPQFGGTASVGQTGQLPADAQSILFRGTVPFPVSFAGTAIPLSVLSSRAGYNIYGGDISQFAGLAGELRIRSFGHFGYLDGLIISSQPIPEPANVSLFVTGLGLLYLRWKR
jgi:hypothetical protein